MGSLILSIRVHCMEGIKNFLGLSGIILHVWGEGVPRARHPNWVERRNRLGAILYWATRQWLVRRERRWVARTREKDLEAALYRIGFLIFIDRPRIMDIPRFISLNEHDTRQPKGGTNVWISVDWTVEDPIERAGWDWWVRPILFCEVDVATTNP